MRLIKRLIKRTTDRKRPLTRRAFGGVRRLGL